MATIAHHPPPAGPDALCERVISERVGTAADDDIALLAVCIDPQP